MKCVRVLVANEPRVYREAFVGALQTLCPAAEIMEAKPKDLDQEVKRFRPDLVLCSRTTSVLEKTVHNWVLLYPENEPLIMIFTSGELSTVANFDLKDLVSLVDRTAAAIDYDRARSP